MLLGARTRSPSFCWYLLDLALPTSRLRREFLKYFSSKQQVQIWHHALKWKARHTCCFSRGSSLQILPHSPLPSSLHYLSMIMGKGYWREGKIFFWEVPNDNMNNLLGCLFLLPIFPQYFPSNTCFFIFILYFYSLFPPLLPALSFTY